MEEKKTSLKTVKGAAEYLGINYRQILQGIREGIVPTYQLRKSRRMVCVDEIIAIMKNQGGQND